MKRRLGREYVEYPAPGIVFRGFYSDQDMTKKFLVDLVSRLDSSGKQIVITSVFPRRSFLEKAKTSLTARTTGHLSIEKRQRISYGHLLPVKDHNVINIWFSGENSRIPSSDGWDAYLSCDVNEGMDRAIFLPFWATRFAQSLESAEKVQKSYLNQRNVYTSDKQGICAVVGNPEPVRLNFIKHLNKVIPIDVFGTITGNRIADKIQLLRRYKMNICFENDSYPNYVTEKVFEAWSAECIPIWWGNDKSNYLNSAAMIELNVENFAMTINSIKEIYSDEVKLNLMANMPLLKKPFDYQKLLLDLQKVL